jgi:hypothetical protein
LKSASTLKQWAGLVRDALVRSVSSGCADLGKRWRSVTAQYCEHRRSVRASAAARRLSAD